MKVCTDTANQPTNQPYHYIGKAATHKAGSMEYARTFFLIIIIIIIIAFKVTNRDRLVGLVVRRPPREWKIPGSNPG